MANEATSAHAPFPDVTGLRTSGPGFSRIGDECEYIEAAFESELDLNSLQDGHSATALLSAWAVILYHYGSHEASNVEIVSFDTGPTQRSLISLDFEQPRSDESFDVDHLYRYVDSRRHGAPPTGQLEHGYAAFLLGNEEIEAQDPPAAFKALRLRSNKELSLILTAHHRTTADGDRLVLVLKASPAVHTSRSAILQLQQVATLLSSFAKDSATHALSVERFDMSLRASDNPNYVHLPAPEYLQDRHHDRLECEFEYFADTRPNDLALDFRFDLQDRDSVKWTYAQMNAKADRVRDLLWCHGIGSASSDQGDHIVALYLEKSPETYLSFLSVVKAGAAWCPIDTDWPASRRQALLAKSNAKVVLVAGDAVSRNLQEDLQSEDMKGRTMHPIRLDQLDASDHPNGAVPRQIQGRSRDQLAYMIWTSGTTGLPKGVGIQHWAIIQAMRALRQKIPYGKAAIGTDEVRYLQYSAYNFDLSIMDCFYAWGIGGTICACPRGLLLQDLVAVGNSFRPTHTLLTPAVMAMTERRAIPSLKVVINGGEKLSQVVADEWSKECCLLNLYGPAEATLIAMNRRVPLGDRVKAPNIGVALPTVSCHALDKADRVVLKGAVGELVLGGPQLARGYVGDPIKTADKFFPHAQLGRVYRTGDLVRQLDNAEFEYLGRIDDQVKINGIRIELLEINAAIKNSHEKVKDSETMAFPRPGSDTELQIINFSVFPFEESKDEQLLRTDPAAVTVARDLQRAAKESLPSYMLPSMFVILSRFPRTSSAKIDRVALKQVLANFDSLDWENKLAEVDGEDLDTPPSDAEDCMRNILAKLCNVAPEKIGRNTPFTSVGLDSIRAITFSQRLLKEGYTVSVVDVAEYPTLIALSRQLDSSASQSEEKRAQAAAFFARFDQHFRASVLQHFGVSSSEVPSILPCTPLQEGMLVESQQDPLSYRIQRQYQISSNVDRRRLRVTLEKLVAEIDSLRTSFVEVGNLGVDVGRQWPTQPFFLQVVWSQTQLELVELDLREDDEVESSVMSALMDQVQLDPFSKRPPLAFLLMRQGPSVHLVLAAHHSIYDARSLAMIESRMEQLYGGYGDGGNVYQFSTALSHILPLTKEDELRRREVWEKALAPFPKGELSLFPNLSGSAAKAGPADANANVHRSRYRTASTSWAEVERVSRKLGVSARPLVQVAWAKVLAAYLDTDHLIIGDSVSGRSAAAELEQVVGPVLSTLPVAIFLDKRRSAAEVAKEVDAFQRSVFTSQHTHLSSLRKVLQLPAGQPLFHSVFVFEPAVEAGAGGGIADKDKLGLQRIADLSVATEHALGVEVQPNVDGSIKIGVSWQRSQVSDAYGRLLLEQFDACLAAICNAPAAPIGDSIASHKAPTDSTELFSISRVERPPSVNQAASVNVSSFVSDAVQSGAGSTNAVEVFTSIPERSAERQASSSITYAGLDEASNRVAALLRGLGLARNAVIAISLQRSVASYIYPLAVLKAGFAYLPLDETLPADRKKLLIQDSSAAILFTDADDARDLVPDAVSVIDVRSEEHRSRLSSSDASNQPSSNDPGDVAFIIYTSGSTGQPKGCLITHRNLSTAIEAFRLVYEREAAGSFNGGARFLARSAEAFDVHLLEIFLSLRVGATIVTGPRHVIHEDLAHTMASLEVTHACVVPSLFFSKGQRARPEQIPTLRALIIGGEAITPDLCELWGSSGSERPVVLNAYGPSEATIGTSIARVSKRSSTGNIGRPFAGTQYLVLKDTGDRLEPALRGEPGELCIAGPQVALGYLNRPELLSFRDWNGQWIYRTGDLVRLNPSDEAEYLGRLDGSQVKVRGARLELGEVDAALQKGLVEVTGRKGVSVTILADHPKITGAPRLVSFVSQTTRRADGSGDGAADLVQVDHHSADLARQLRRASRSRLPQYMVPSQVLPLAFLPLSVLSGKVDRKALKTLYHSLDPVRLGVADQDSTREASKDEKKIAAVLASVLRFGPDEAISPEADLIALGLDSLTVVTFAAKLRKSGIAATAATILNEPTIEAIASRARDNQDGGMAQRRQRFDAEVESRTALARSLTTLEGKVVQKALPCVPLQVALIAQATSESSSSPRYVTTVSIDVAGHYSSDEMQSAWREVLQRHEIYRTIFCDLEDELCQIVLDAASCPDVWYPSTEASLYGSSLEQYHGEAAKDIASSFSERPALRLKLWQNGSSQQITLTCSHAIYDGTSLNQLLREVGEHLQGQSSATAGQFFEAVREIMGQSGESARKYWTTQLDGFSRTSVPTLTGKKAGAERATAEELQVPSAHSYSVLEAAARSRGVTVHSLLVAAFCRLMADYVGDDDVTIGLVLGGRTLNLDDVDLIHGPCVTTVPFRLGGARRSAPEDLSRLVHRRINDALPFQHVSLPQLMRWMSLDQSPFEALFSYLGSQKDQGSSVLLENGTTMERDYPLAAEASVSGDRVSLHVAFSTNLLPKAHAALFLSQLDSVIGQVAGIASAQIADKSLSVLNRDCYVPSSDSESFLSRFAAQVRDQPDSTAVVFAHSLSGDKQSVSYRQLDQLSDNMARHLVKQSSDIIGVHLTKDGPGLYAAMIAVWKAGKVYLPLDPSLPRERLQYMLETVGKAPAITNGATRATLAGFDSECLDVMQLQEPADSSVQLPKPSLDRACYLLFTSGSTGRPKAVQIGQRALSGAIYSWERMLPWSKESRFLQLASIGFDVSLIEVCMPLALGFSIGTAPKEVLIEDLTTAIHQLGITIADLPAALAGTVHPADVDLEWLMSGGDAIDERVILDWTEADRVLINAWGPTETTIGSSLGRVTRGSSRSHIGQAYPACSLFVLKEDSTELALRGAVGELAVGGPQLADQYFGRDDLTAEKFVQLQDGTRVYRTGDLGRFLVDGSVECLGRLGSDRQVKVNGQRVELDEISQALAIHAEVRDADVQYLKHPSMSAKQLVAFIAPNAAVAGTDTPLAMRQDVEAVELSSKLEQDATKRLAPYMIPTHWLVVNGKLPLTPNNKVDHKALAALFESTETNALSHFGSLRQGALSQSSWSRVEAELRELIATFCNVPIDNITKTTSFHRLGIDSITAIKLVKVLRTAGYRVSVADILSSPFVGSLAERHGEATQAPTDVESLPERLMERVRSKADPSSWKLSEDDQIVSALPCTPLQAGMITQTLASSGKLYFHHHAFQVAAEPAKVVVAWQALVWRLDILRTSFHPIQDELPWVQAVHKVGDPKVVKHAGTFAGEMQQLEAVQGQLILADEEAFHRPPHALHVWTDGEKTTLVVSIHHALYDAASLPLLLSDLGKLILDLEGEASLPKRASFHRLVPHLLPSDADTRHWAEQLQGLQSALLRDPKAKTERGGHAVEAEHPISIPLKAVQQACVRTGVSVQVLATLAYAKLLAIETGSGDVCFGQIFGLRDAVEDREASIGPALNTVATRVSFDDPSRTVDEQLQRMQSANDAGRPHRKASLREVQQAVTKAGGKQPALFDALFDFQIVPDSDEDSGLPAGLRPVSLSSEEGSPQYALNVEFVQGSDALTLVSTADSIVFDASALAGLLQRLDKIFVHLVQQTTNAISQLPFEQPSFPAAVTRAPADGNAQHADLSGPEDGRVPETVEGKKLAQVISRVSGVSTDKIYASTRLSSLGLDSISAIRIASLARREGMVIGVADIVSADTVEGIIDLIAAKREAAAPVVDDPMMSHQAREAVKLQLQVDEASVERILPLLSGQAVLVAGWIQTDKRFGLYSWAFKAGQRLDRERLSAAWTELVKRHAILRTAFVCLEGRPAQVVLKPEHSQQRVRDVACQGDLEAAAKDTIRTATAATWDLRTPPLQLSHLHAEGSGEDAESVLALTLHHLLYDAFSIDLLVRDLEALYTGRSCSSSNEWIEFVDHLSSSRATRSAEAAAFWKESLQDADVAVLPEQAGSTSRTDEVFTLHPNILTGYRQFESALAARQTSVQALFLAAWSHLLAQRTGKRAPLFGVFQLGRSASFDGIERLAGPCMSILPMALSTTAEPHGHGHDDADPLLSTAQHAATHLRRRARFEQTDLLDVHQAAGLPTHQAAFNTYLNVLLPAPSSSHDHAATPPAAWTSVPLGDPTEFAPREPKRYGSTLDAMRHVPLVQSDVSVDVALNARDDAITIAIRARQAVLSAHEAAETARLLAHSVRTALHSL